jgi:hypothetical protein
MCLRKSERRVDIVKELLSSVLVFSHYNMSAPNSTKSKELSDTLSNLSVQSTLANAPRAQGDWVEPNFALFVLAGVSNNVSHVSATRLE